MLEAAPLFNYERFTPSDEPSRVFKASQYLCNFRYELLRIYSAAADPTAKIVSGCLSLLLSSCDAKLITPLDFYSESEHFHFLFETSTFFFETGAGHCAN